MVGQGQGRARSARALGLVVVCWLALAGCDAPWGQEQAAPPAPGLPRGADEVVRQVVDGDTLLLDGGGTVRMIGVDTPETQHPRKGLQCFGKEATRYTASLLPRGTWVRLVTDAEKQDRYARTLAYVYRLADGLFVNAKLVKDGYAQPLTIPPNTAHADEFVQLAREARAARRGLWGRCGDTLRAPAPAPTAPAAGSGRCHPAYPGVCIPPPPPDLDCADLRQRGIGGGFAARPPDPHRLDGDGNGRGCG